MTKKTRWIIISIIFVLIIAMIAFPIIRKHLKAKENTTTLVGNSGGKRVLNVEAEVLKSTAILDQIVSVGSTIPDEEVNLAFEASGKLTGIFFKEGAYVNKGDLLAKINDVPLQAQLKKLKAQVPLMTTRVYRQKTLLEKDAVSRETYESVVTEKEKLDADIELVEANIAQTELRAPFDGRIGLRYVSEGAYLSPSTVIASLARISPLKIEFSVPESHSSLIKEGTDIVFRMENDRGLYQDYQAEVYAVASVVDTDTRTLKVRAKYPNTKKDIMPGRHVSIIIEREKIEGAISIPNEAIIPEMGKNIVYLYKSGKAVPVEITLGIRSSDRVQVTNGVEMGDTLLTTGVMQLRSGMAVSIDNLK